MSKPTVLNPFTLDLDSHSFSHGSVNKEPSLTVQADVEQSDINNIVRQFGITHELPYGLAVPVYDDFSDAPNDYHQAMNFIREANSTFMEFPAELRSRFDNDAGSFLDFVNNPTNYDEAISLGLVPSKDIQPQAAQPSAGDGLPNSTVPPAGTEA